MSRRLVFLLLLGALGRDAAAADEDRGSLIVIGRPSFRSLDLEDQAGRTTTIRQLHVSFTGTVAAGPAIDLLALGAFADTRLTLSNDDEASLSGLTDLRFKGVWRPAGKTFLALGVGLPAGKQTLEQGGKRREIEVAQAMWSPLLGFRARRMNEGFDVEFSGGYATELSPTVTLGLGLGYVIKGEYDLFETEDGVFPFKPGGEASASLGLDVRPAEGTLLRLDVAGRSFFDDESDGAKVYRAGSQLEIDAVFHRVMPKWSLMLRARNVAKEDDEQFEEVGEDLASTAIRSANSFWAMGEVYLNVSSSVAVGGEAGAGFFGAAEAALSDGTTFEIGPGLRAGTGEGGGVSVQAHVVTGSAADGLLDLSGVDISGALTLIF